MSLFELSIDVPPSIFECRGVWCHAFVFGLAILQLNMLGLYWHAFFLLQNTTLVYLIGAVFLATSLCSLIFDWGLPPELIGGIPSSDCARPIGRGGILS